MSLNHRQVRFVDEYLHDLNATRAAIRAGYGSKNADTTGARLLVNVGIARAIEEAKAVRAARTRITQDKVIDELAALVHSDVSHYEMDEHGNLALAAHAPRNAMKAVSSVKRRRIVRTDKDGGTETTYEVEFKLWDKPGQIKLAGRHVNVKGFAERVEHTGKDGGPIELSALSTEEKRERLMAIRDAVTKRLEAEPVEAKVEGE